MTDIRECVPVPETTHSPLLLPLSVVDGAPRLDFIENASGALSHREIDSPEHYSAIVVFGAHANVDARAEFIVRACNSHQALVKSCAELLDGILALREWAVERGSHTKYPALFDGFERGIAEARAALLAAQER